MKKELLSILIFFKFTVISAQIGINTVNPTATLDITAKNITGTSTNVDGLLVPRIDRQRAQSMTGTPVSTLVYINSVSTGSQTGTAINIDAVGHYFYNGTVWVKLQTPSAPSLNLYNSNGSITGERTITQAGYSINFTGGSMNIVPPLSGPGLSITSPSNILMNNSPRIFSAAGLEIQSNDNQGVVVSSGIYPLVNTNPVFRVYYANLNNTPNIIEFLRVRGDGKVGIGTATPTSLLSVNGSADKPGGGSWGTFSDQRVKKDIEEFKDGLNVINQLKPVTYRYNKKSGYQDLSKKYVGFIAQDVEKAAPYMVNITDDSQKSGLKDKREFDESALTKILVNAVKEQQQEIAQLRKEVEELKRR